MTPDDSSIVLGPHFTEASPTRTVTTEQWDAARRLAVEVRRLREIEEQLTIRVNMQSVELALARGHSLGMACLKAELKRTQDQP